MLAINFKTVKKGLGKLSIQKSKDETKVLIYFDFK